MQSDPPVRMLPAWDQAETLGPCFRMNGVSELVTGFYKYFQLNCLI